MRAARIYALSLIPLSWFYACSADQASSGPNLAGAAGQAQAGETSSTGGQTDGSGGSSETGGSPAAGSPATGGDSASAGSGGSGATSTGGSSEPPDAGEWPDVVFEYDAGDAGEPDACASTTVTAEPIPLDLVILLDRSGSMNEPGWQYYQWRDADCNVDETPIKDAKWCRAINALMDFFEAPSSVGNGVGFSTFAGDEGDCEAYPTLDVPFGVIGGGTNDPLLGAIETVLNDQHAEGSTPTERALKTIVNFTLSRQQANEISGNTNRRVIGILVTDGEPQNCNTDEADLNDIVEQHFIDTDIPTFFIGMEGADYVGLETMAAGAGAPEHTDGCNAALSPCHYYDVGQGDGTILIDTLEEIRRTVIGCQFAIPTAEVGLVDLETIEVRYTPSGGSPEVLPRVLGGETACGSNPGYYTDDDTNPTTILLCPATCSRAEADPDSSVSIEILCEGS